MPQKSYAKVQTHNTYACGQWCGASHCTVLYVCIGEGRGFGVLGLCVSLLNINMAQIFFRRARGEICKTPNMIPSSYEHFICTYIKNV